MSTEESSRHAVKNRIGLYVQRVGLFTDELSRMLELMSAKK